MSECPQSTTSLLSQYQVDTGKQTRITAWQEQSHLQNLVLQTCNVRCLMGPAQGVGGDAWKGRQWRAGRLRNHVRLRRAGRGRGGRACAAPAHAALSGSSSACMLLIRQFDPAFRQALPWSPALQGARAAFKATGAVKLRAVPVACGSAAFKTLNACSAPCLDKVHFCARGTTVHGTCPPHVLHQSTT
jgi:hypothetical protein